MRGTKEPRRLRKEQENALKAVHQGIPTGPRRFVSIDIHGNTCSMTVRKQYMGEGPKPLVKKQICKLNLIFPAEREAGADGRMGREWKGHSDH